MQSGGYMRWAEDVDLDGNGTYICDVFIVSLHVPYEEKICWLQVTTVLLLYT